MTKYNRRQHTRTTICLLLILFAAKTYAAEPAFRTKFDRKLIRGQQVLVCKRVKTPPKIDGEVDKDPVWQTVNRTRGAWTELGTRSVSGRQTVVYTCFDDKHLYFGFVCEETDLSRVRMDGKLDKADSIEVVLEVGGLMGTGQIRKFRVNTRSQPRVWKSAGKFGPNRWMIEMAIPLSSLKKISNPQRGDIIGIKFARYGRTPKTGEERMISTSNTQLPFRYLYLCGYNHLLYFEDSNVLQDGDFSAPAIETYWNVEGKTVRGKQGITLSKGSIIRQVVKLRKQSSYAVAVTQKGKAKVRVRIGKKEIKLDTPGRGEYWNKSDDTATFTIEALEDAVLRHVVLRYEPGIEPPGPMCLTNNYQKPARNIRTIQPDAPEGQYRYVRLDYADRLERDDAPNIKLGRSRSRYYRAPTMIEDLGGNMGWIPFSKGSLTGRPESAFWITIGKSTGHGRHNRVVLEIDLGQEYFVSGFDMLWPAPYIQNVEIWGKPEGAEHWMLLYVADDVRVDPKKRLHYARKGRYGVGFARTRGLDSVVRYLRWRGTARSPLYPQMDGIQEFWIWGQPKGKRTGLKLFTPWISDDKLPPVKPITWTPNRERGQIVPRPRQMKLTAGRFLVNPDTRIVYQDEPEARKITAQIRQEILERWGIKIAAVRENDAGTETSNTIYLGQPRLGKAAQDRANQAGLKLNLAPQGYGLLVRPQSVAVLGRDSVGLYYGVQSLMLGMRWYQGKTTAESGPSCQSMRVIDWPGTLERGIFTSNKPHYNAFRMPTTELWRIRRMGQYLSRFKINVMYIPGEKVHDAAYGWPKGTLAQLCRELKDQYHLEIRPDILSGEKEVAGWYRNLFNETQAWDSADHDPDESPRRLGLSTNPCPLDPKMYKIMFNRIDRILEQFDWPSQVWMRNQIYFGVGDGARWGVCRRCQRSGKTEAELYAYFLHRVSDHLKRRGARGLLSDRKLSYGAVGQSRDRLDIRMVPRNLRMVPSDFAPKSGKLDQVWDYLRQSVPPEFVVNGPPGWPSRERIKGVGGSAQGALAGLCGAGSGYAQEMWYAPDAPPKTPIDLPDLAALMNTWWFQRDLPAWRLGVTPTYHPIDLRAVVNHLSHPTGTERFEAGRLPEIDLRYLKTGKQILSGVEFDIIDPARNNGKAVLMVGRPGDDTPPNVKASIFEITGPIPVGRKLASLAFLRTRWRASSAGGRHNNWWAWLRPTCRVVYDDDRWLVVDAFSMSHDDWLGAGDLGVHCRLGWLGNAPTSKTAALKVIEWVNPYPDKVIKHLDFFTPAFTESQGKRVNPWVEAVVAITGVGVVDQDIKTWSKRLEKPPLLPPRKARPQNLVELIGRSRRSGSSGQVKLEGPRGTVACSIAPMKNTLRKSIAIYPGAYTMKGLVPFGVTLKFDKPVALAAVELTGPTHTRDRHLSGYSPRMRKVDVIVEYSTDHKEWKKAGELKGICAEADFVPVALPGIPIRGLRLTGTGAPYPHSYMGISKYGLFGQDFLCPMFAWRLFVPAKAESE